MVYDGCTLLCYGINDSQINEAINIIYGIDFNLLNHSVHRFLEICRQ